MSGLLLSSTCIWEYNVHTMRIVPNIIIVSVVALKHIEISAKSRLAHLILLSKVYI